MNGYYLKHQYKMGRASGLCFNPKQEYQKWKMPLGKSESEFLLMKTTSTACMYVPPTGVGVKHDSYARVLQRRRHVAQTCPSSQ